MKKLFFLLTACLYTFIVTAQTEKLNNYLFKLYDNEKIMASAAVAVGDNITFQRAYGKLNYKAKPIKDADIYSRYRIGSLTKMYTATLILQLVESGQISLDTKLSTFYKNIPNASKITIKQMLNHHSGIADYTKKADYIISSFEEMSQSQILARIASSPAAFEPGKKGQYSNSNYTILGYIIEKITGTNFALAVQRNITERIGLGNTYYGLDATPERNEATSFSLSTDGWKQVPETHMSIPGAAGGLVATPADLCKFVHALFQGTFFSDAMLQTMLTLEDDFGLGIFQYKTADRILYGHTGAIDGFSSMLVYDPETKTSVALCANGVNYNIKDATYNLYKITQGLDVDLPEVAAVKIAKEKLPKYTGEFYSEKLGKMLSIDHVDQTLMARLEGQPAFPLAPNRETQFVYPLYKVQIDYSNLEDDIYNSITLTQGPNVIVFERR